MVDRCKTSLLVYSRERCPRFDPEQSAWHPDDEHEAHCVMDEDGIWWTITLLPPEHCEYDGKRHLDQHCVPFDDTHPAATELDAHAECVFEDTASGRPLIEVPAIPARGPALPEAPAMRWCWTHVEWVGEGEDARRVHPYR